MIAASNMADINRFVEVIHETGILRASIKTAPQVDLGTQFEFAFYVFKNEERVHTARYSSRNILDFRIGPEPGYYRIAGFLKNPDGTINVLSSNPVFVNPKEIRDNFSDINAENTAHLFIGNNWRIPSLYHDGQDDWLYVLTPSSVDRSKVRLPAFSRWARVKKNIYPGKVLCLADPTIEQDPELRIGWCLGNINKCATDEIADAITGFARHLNIPNQKIVYWGSSAGGFAALALAARTPGSTAVAINAQTNALEFDMPELAGQVELVRRVCLGDLDPRTLMEKMGGRLDMSRLWTPDTHSRAFLVQNRLDLHHHEKHFVPFWTNLGGTLENDRCAAKQHTAWLYDDPNGHVPETEAMSVEIISDIQNTINSSVSIN